MADDVAQVPEEIIGAGISDASPATPDSGPADAKANPDRKAAPTNKPDPAASPDAGTADPSQQGLASSQFAANQKYSQYQRVLGLQHYDPHLAAVLADAQPRTGKDGQSILLDLADNGHTIQCGKLKDGVEFIGMPHKKAIVDDHDAEVMVRLAKARGWKGVNVTGSEQEKERLWLAAMRQGMGVANYQPDPNSAVAKKWEAEFAAMPQPSLTEAKPEDFHQKTIALLTEKAAALTDKDAKAGVETILKKFTENAVTGNEDIYKGLSQALAGKDERAGYNQAVELLNKAEPKLGLTRLEAATPAAAANEASKPAPQRPATPAPKMG